MNLRELLKHELWSKRTTRKILVWSGTFLGFVIAVLTIWILVEKFWLTPGERRAGKAALAQIDTLQDFESMTGRDFNAKSRQAGKEIDAAQNSAWTWRDKGVAESLSLYLDMTKIDQDYVQRRKHLEQNHPEIVQKDVEMAQEMVANGKKTRSLFRSILHGALD